MSRISSTFGRSTGLKSSLKSSGVRHPETSTGIPQKSSTGPSNSLLKSSGNLSTSFTGSMSGKLNASGNLERIEGEYIKNLQQQVYFLELEANYLNREQVKKATDMHPAMTMEAERMLNKLRQMQAEVDSLNVENRRKESSIDMAITEKEQILQRMKGESGTHQREKRLLMDELVQLKKEKQLIERDNTRKDSQIFQAREELDKSAGALRTAETQIQLLRNQMEQKFEQHKLTQSALEEKRTELLKTETQLRELEDKYYSSTTSVQEQLVPDLRDEIRMLRQKLKETEMAADQDRYLRTKLSDDSSHLVKENALLNQQVIELQKQLEREKGLRETQDNRRSQSITELVVLKDREKQLQFDLNQMREELKHEKERVKHYMDQLARLEHASTSQELNASTTRSKLAEFEAVHQKTETDNSQLRRDKMLLVDHVADLQQQLDEKEKEIVRLRSERHSHESRLKELDHLKTLEASIQSQKWEEFSRLADSMKSLSNTMAKSATSNFEYA